MLSDYLKQNIEWLCLKPSEKSPCVVLVAPFFYEIKFIIDESKFLSRVEHHAFVERLIKKYKKRHFDDFFNREIIETMTFNFKKIFF